MWLSYFHAHYQDNVVAGFINSIVIGIAAYFIILKKMLVCQEKWCFRIGHHKVEGTHYKTCPKHSTAEIHKKWQHKHNAKYPEQHEFLKKDTYEH
jgi:hypothetical protein